MDAAEEVKNHLDIADIVGEYLPLKPAGSGSFKACCPFHQERTPSFYVNRPRQSWHCFGCNKGGDMISFVMELEGMEFRDALEHLAQKAGVTLPSFNPETSGRKKRLSEINDLASKFFRAQLLQSPQAGHARAYAEKRNIDNLIGDLFKIGYAPDSWDALLNALNEKGITNEEIADAGLCSKRQDGSGWYDRFRNRLMFAIQDVHGNVVGFTGRQLDPDAKEAKYVNTPETQIYKKSNILYGLDKAKGDVKSKNLCVIVEGNMDALSSHRVGISNVVASSGTALTSDQLKLISRFTKNLAIAFDSDSAGINATLRGLDLARAQDFRISVIILPEEAGKDPDDAITKDPAIWKEAIAKAVPIMDWVFHSAFRGKNISNPDDKSAIAEAVLPEVRRIPDPIIRDHWLQKLSDALETSESALRDALSRLKTASDTPVEGRTWAVRSPQTPISASDAEDSVSRRKRDLAERIICILLIKPDLRSLITEDVASTFPEDIFHLYRTPSNVYHSAQSIEVHDPEAQSSAPEYQQKNLVDYLTIRADRDYPNQQTDTLTSELQLNLAAFKKLWVDDKRKRLEEAMRSAELSGDRNAIEEIAKRFQDLQ